MALPVVFFIACHGGPADHFATYSAALSKKGYGVEFQASGAALNQLTGRGVKIQYPFALDNLSSVEEDELARKIANNCQQAAMVVIDLGHRFDIKIQKALSEKHISHFVYYDNPEPYVPGGYSSIAAEVMKGAQAILFARKSLAEGTLYQEPGKPIDLSNKKRVGIGYYPVAKGKELADRRKKEHNLLRDKFLQDQGIEEQGKKILVYFGGNNEEYFSKAFPAFLSILKQAKLLDVIVVLQQHPAAKEKNRDGGLIADHQVILSTYTSDDAQVLADVALYYQTSMGPQILLAGIPAIQIGHEPYVDILVKDKSVPSITTSDQLVEALKNLTPPEEKKVLECLGVNDNWPEVLAKALSIDN